MAQVEEGIVHQKTFLKPIELSFLSFRQLGASQLSCCPTLLHLDHRGGGKEIHVLVALVTRAWERNSFFLFFRA